MLLSATNSAQSDWPWVEKVQEPTRVTWRRSMSGLTSIITLPRSPT